MMKRLVPLLLACLLSTVLFACQANPNVTSKPTSIVLSRTLYEEYKTNAGHLNDFMDRYPSLNLSIGIEKEFSGGDVDKITDTGTVKVTMSGINALTSLSMTRDVDGQQTKTEMTMSKDSFQIKIGDETEELLPAAYRAKLKEVSRVYVPEFGNSIVQNVVETEGENDDDIFTFELYPEKSDALVQAMEKDVDLSDAEVTVESMSVVYTRNWLGNPVSYKISYVAKVKDAEVSKVTAEYLYTIGYTN